VAGELDLLAGRQLQNLLEPPADRQEDTPALLGSAALSTSDITISSVGNMLSYGASPHTDTIKRLTDVDDNAHDLPVVLVLEGLANSGHHDLEPETVDLDVALVLVLVRPLAAVLVLGVFPLGPDAGLEKVIVGLLGQFGDGGDIVLRSC
jgi:hypothetical protein